MSVESSFVVIKWSGKEFRIPVTVGDTIASLKRKIQIETNVQPKRQKLLGLKSKTSKSPDDETFVSDLQLKPGQKLLLMGTTEQEILSAQRQEAAAPQVQDDFDLNEGDLQQVEVKDKEENQEKLRRRIASVDLKILNPPRAGKKCLVLDIDYTLFDLGSTAERPDELARPYLHEFLAAAYLHYDILIWSATSMKWVDVKMRELGVLGHPDYKIVCLLDHSAMLTVQTEQYGVFDCKPLAFIWAKYPEYYNEDNTIMLDDVRRNFVMNKQNGLVIKPYKKAHSNRHTDKELRKLKVYLIKVASLQSLRHLKHKRWESYIADELAALQLN